VPVTMKGTHCEVERDRPATSKGNSLDAASYLRGLLRSWWLILLVLAAGGVGGYIVYDRATPEYSADVTFIIASNSPDADEVSARTLTELRATTTAKVAPTEPVLAQAAEKAGRSDDLGGVTVTASSSESFVYVAVRGPNPETVRDIAAAYPDIIMNATDKLAGESGTPFKLNTVAKPLLPTDPVSPILSRDVGFGLAVGLILGLAMAVLRETLNRTVRDTEELRELAGVPLLAIVPKDLPNQLLPSDTHPRSARAEAYRQARTTLLSVSDHRPLIVAVTSATLGEGKTSVAANLSIALSRAGHRVALVDADLRRPRVADFMGISAAPGLTDVLIGGVTLKDALVLRDEGRLGVLPAGSIPTNPSEALGSPAMVDVLRDLSDEFEFIIVDTPPVVPVTDALVLAPWMDGIVLVARLGETTPDRIRRALAALDRVHAQVFGIVANQAGKGSDAVYSYTYKSKRSVDNPVEDVPMREGTSAGQEQSSGGRHRSGPRPTVPVSDGGAPHGGRDAI
jgi:polysaccharide biosynthesis transport protein